MHLLLLCSVQGLIPIVSKRADDFRAWWEDKDDGEEELVYTLSVHCDSEEVLDVTSNHFKVDSRFEDVVPINYDPDESGVQKGIVITKLQKGQGLKVRAVVRKSIGKDHAKWNPCATAVFKIPPEIHINNQMLNKLTESQKQELADSCPTKVFRVNKQKNELEVENAELYTYDNEILRKVSHLFSPLVSSRLFPFICGQQLFLGTLFLTSASLISSSSMRCASPCG